MAKMVLCPPKISYSLTTQLPLETIRI